jgi:DNA-binding response OmpR family regulator
MKDRFREDTLAKPKILIVDHDQISNKFVGSHLEAHGYQILMAINDQEALQIIEKELPSLILLDMTLPHAASFRVCRKVRESSDVPIIMLSESNSELDKVKCFDLGADDFVTKPFSLEILICRIRAVLRRFEKSQRTSAKSPEGDLFVEGKSSLLIY